MTTALSAAATLVTMTPRNRRLSYRHPRLLARFRALDLVGRSVLYATMGIPFAVVVVLWKAGVLAAAPSALLAANVGFAAVILILKARVILLHRASRTGAAVQPADRTHSIGFALIGAGMAYGIVAASTSQLPGATEKFDGPVAIMIAAVAFTELTVSLIGVIGLRRIRDRHLGAIRSLSLANSFALIALAQQALLASVWGGDARGANALTCTIVGGLIALVGVSTFRTGRRPRRPQGVHRESALKRKGEVMSSQLSNVAFRVLWVALIPVQVVFFVVTAVAVFLVVPLIRTVASLLLSGVPRVAR